MSFKDNFDKRTDLQKYAENALILYTLQLKYGIEDIDEVASNSLTGGGNDKKTDLVYYDESTKEVVIGQAYMSNKERGEAPANKASDLNTSVPWLLARNLDDLPIDLKSVALELRNRINENEIERISLWYSHNLPESENVRQELQSVENTLSATLNNYFPDHVIEIHALEIGLETLEDWYEGLTIPILFTDEIQLTDCEGYEASGENWSSFNTSIKGNQIRNLFVDHKKKLFTANVRDYLGSRRSSGNINNGIKLTASKEPQNFFVYNNGITALVNDFEYDKESKSLKVSGLSIVNGAQTTGAIGSLENELNDNMEIPIRLIKCNSQEIVASIVKYNNSQNKINAPDFRSGDKYQKRIFDEFQDLGVIEYASRRGGASDVIRRNPNSLASVTAGQALAAFHGEPSTAYNEKTKIWDKDDLYFKFFGDFTTAQHILFCYSLLKTIEELKFNLGSKPEDEMLEDDVELLKYLRSRGAIVLLVTAVADCIENILDRRVANKFRLAFNDNPTLEDAKANWIPVLEIASNFTGRLAEGLQDGIKNKEKIEDARRTFKDLFSAVRKANAAQLDLFASKVVE